MKKNLFVLLLTATAIAGLVQSAHAQKRNRNNTNGPIAPMRVGSATLNLGIGVGSEYKGDYYRSPLGIKAALEFGLWQAGPAPLPWVLKQGLPFPTAGITKIITAALPSLLCGLPGIADGKCAGWIPMEGSPQGWGFIIMITATIINTTGMK